MSHKYYKAVLFILLAVLVAGCASSGVKVRGYAEDKERIDQELQGNSGYLMGKPEIVENDRKKTRKIYVLEVTKDPVKPNVGKYYYIKRKSEKEPDRSAVYYEEPVKKPYIAPEPVIPIIDIPSFDDEEIFEEDEEAPIEAKFVEYTVEKDDTLQKISKKFYDSYSKWPRIYEANKEVIKNPDRIKPGIVIQIPVE